MVTRSGRTFLEYDCPLLGYRELLFPIFFEDRVVAAIFIGEICLEGQRDLVATIQSRFFELHPDCFDGYCCENREQSPDWCREQIQTENARL